MLTPKAHELQQQDDSDESEQNQSVAEAPAYAVPNYVFCGPAPGCDGGHGGDMIGFQRVLHTHQRPQKQGTGHFDDRRYTALTGIPEQ
jgi:hypothetical protein